VIDNIRKAAGELLLPKADATSPDKIASRNWSKPRMRCSGACAKRRSLLAERLVL
jgi:hypothetical protein